MEAIWALFGGNLGVQEGGTPHSYPQLRGVKYSPKPLEYRKQLRSYLGPRAMTARAPCPQSSKEVIHRFPGDADVLAEAALALGALGGVLQVLAMLAEVPRSVHVQQAGCRAMAELCRMGLSFRDDVEIGDWRSGIHAQGLSFQG